MFGYRHMNNKARTSFIAESSIQALPHIWLSVQVQHRQNKGPPLLREEVYAVWKMAEEVR